MGKALECWLCRRHLTRVSVTSGVSRVERELRLESTFWGLGFRAHKNSSLCFPRLMCGFPSPLSPCLKGHC